MKIHFAIMACDDNELYAGLWRPVKEAWKKLGIEPLLIYIGQKKSGVQFDPNVLYFEPLEGIKTSFQAQIARIWAFKLINETETNAIISDVDMMPLSKEYFTVNALKADEETILSYSSDAYQQQEIPMCYILANTKLMAGLIEAKTWPEFAYWMALETGQGWGGDQWFITSTLKKYSKVIHLERGWNEAGQASRRIDRDDWRYHDNRVKEGFYFDAHLPRPYSQHKETIDKLLSLIP